MTQQQRYEVLAQYPGFEVRRYPAHLIAEVEVGGSFIDAGNRAFGVLVGYISGRNTSRARVAMTAPVLQERAGEPIAMTAPVVQQPTASGGRHAVAFVMPSGYTLDTLPAPADSRITLREVPAQVAAVDTFSGRWTEATYLARLDGLRASVARQGFDEAGSPRFARFDPPWTPWFLRRNEIVLPVVMSHRGDSPSSSR